MPVLLYAQHATVSFEEFTEKDAQRETRPLESTKKKNERNGRLAEIGKNELTKKRVSEID